MRPITACAMVLFCINAAQPQLFASEEARYIALPLADLIDAGLVDMTATETDIGKPRDALINIPDHRTRFVSQPAHLTLTFKRPVRIAGSRVMFSHSGAPFLWTIACANNTSDLDAGKGTYKELASNRSVASEVTDEVTWAPYLSSIWRLTCREREGDQFCHLDRFELLCPEEEYMNIIGGTGAMETLRLIDEDGKPIESPLILPGHRCRFIGVRSVQDSGSAIVACDADLRRALTKASLSSLPDGKTWQARWDLDLDGQLEGEVETRLYRFDVANNQLRIRFAGKDRPLNKKHARIYHGEVVAGQKPIIIWRRDDMDGYAAAHILHLTRPGCFRGTWVDNLGHAGDIELTLRDRRKTEVGQVVSGRVVPPGARVIDFESIPPTDLRETESPDFLAGHGIAEISAKAQSDKSDLLVRDAGRYKKVKAIPTSGKQFFEQRAENPDTHSVTLTFDPSLVHFGFSRIGTTGGSSTPRWKAEAFDEQGEVIDAREEGFLVNGPARAYDFVAPVGRRIRSVTFTSTNNMRPGGSTWSSFSSVPLDDFVLTPAE